MTKITSLAAKACYHALLFAQHRPVSILRRIFVPGGDGARADTAKTPVVARMELYDIIMLGVLVAAAVFGAWKGMAWQVASTASLVVSYLVALRFSPQIAHYFGDQAPLNRFIAMLVLYVGTSIAIWLAFRVVARFLDRMRLREFDRQMGALFGLAKGVLLCVAITFFAVTLSAKGRALVLNARSGRYIAVLLDRADTVMPSELHDVLGPYLHKLEHELDPNAEPAHATIPDGEKQAEQGSGAATL